VRTKIFFISALLLISINVTAQKKFLVYHVNGDVNLISGSNAATAKRGDALMKNNKLLVKPGANCMVIGDKGNSVQLTSGTYTFDEVEKRMANAAGTNVTQKFFSYVYENLSSGKSSDKLSVTPVVFRGDELLKIPSDNTIVMSDIFTVGWKKPAGKIPVHLTIMNINNEKIIDTILKNSTSLILDINKYTFASGEVYKWKTEESDTHQPKEKYFSFLIPAKHDRKKILEELKVLQNKGMSNDLKMQMQHDIFYKWKQFYSK
jgi:hypothetical protein